MSDALLAQGAQSVSVEDANAGTTAEAPLYGEPGVAMPDAWPQSLVKALCAHDADPPKIIAAACAQAGLQTLPEYRTELLGDEDWVRLSQSQFEPIRISDRLWIVPSWASAPDTHAINLVLDPGLAFGTGSHPTTRLCLQWLERTVRGGERVLDYGCGSGVLGNGAPPLRVLDKLWIVPSWALAPDPHAVNLVLDPGLAFGTGSHPTTRLCLQWLGRTIRGGERVLDYGCG